MASVYDKAMKAATIAGQIAPYIRTANLLRNTADGITTDPRVGAAATALGIQSPAPQTAPPKRAQQDFDSYFNTETGLLGGEAQFLGGFTPAEALQQLRQFRQHTPALKSLYIVSIAAPALTAEQLGVEPEIRGAAGDVFGVPEAFSLYATDVNYTPITVTGEKRMIGGVRMDTIMGVEPVEVSVTTMDDERGLLKRWAKAMRNLMFNGDGTVGVPADYAMTLTIKHAFASPNAKGFKDAYADTMMVRIQSMPLELNRAERGQPQMIQITFTQMDTFIPVRAVGP